MKKIYLTLLILGMSWFSGLIWFNQHINSYPPDDGSKTEAIIALTGGRNRIGEAISLLNQGMGDKLFISGVQKNISIKELEKRKDLNFINNDKIFIGKESSNTVENAIETHNWLKQNNIKSIRLVTSNYHIPRSLEEFYSQDASLNIVIHPVFSENVKKSWWKSWGSFYLISLEYNKFLYVYFAKRLNLRK